jgi:uncharacterized protein
MSRKPRQMQGWLGEQDPDDLVISDWVATEFSAALSIKLRTGRIEPRHRADALTMFSRRCNDNVTVMPVSRAQFRIAARFVDQYALGLRDGDALHLAACAEQGETICTLDRRLSEAASPLGIKTEPL